MKVYIVTENTNWDGVWNRAVFSNLDLAKLFILKNVDDSDTSHTWLYEPQYDETGQNFIAMTYNLMEGEEYTTWGIEEHDMADVL